jgi:hypothetical protein
MGPGKFCGPPHARAFRAWDLCWSCHFPLAQHGDDGACPDQRGADEDGRVPF